MKTRLLLAVVLVGGLILPYTTFRPAPAFAAPFALEGDLPAVPGEFVVGFAPAAVTGSDLAQTTAAMANSVAKSVGGQVLRSSEDMALIKLDDATTANVQSAMTTASAMGGVKFVEPNYLYSIPETQGGLVGVITNPKAVIQRFEGGKTESIPVEELKALTTKENGQIMATFPNDTSLYTNWGWDWIGTGIIWPNAAVASRVCVIDTGVDATSPDLVGKVLHGYDFFSVDSIAEDDNGHGTHVAGIITAAMNNAKGIAGVSNGGVLAVKVLGSQGVGTTYDIALGIRFCANNPAVKVISMSLGGGYSNALYWAVDYAVNPTNWPPRLASAAKLIVAAAGNSNSSTPIYPAGFSDNTFFPEFNNKVLAVAALEDPYDGVGNGADCRASFSNFGSWVDIAAPGQNIYSTTPGTAQFWLNYYNGVTAQYASMSGTSMATPFVAATAARTWSIAPFTTYTPEQMGARLASTGYNLNANNTCWPTGTTTVGLNVAAAMDRSAITWFLYNANNGLPLIGATGQVYQGLVLKGSGVVDGLSAQFSSARLIILNLPSGAYTLKVSKPGFTATPQGMWFNVSTFGGYYFFGLSDAVPPLSTNFDIVSSWYNNTVDLDMYTFLPCARPLGGGPCPSWPNGSSVLDANRVVGFRFRGTFNPLPYPDNSTGSPYARWVRDGGAFDFLPLEIARIKPWPVNPNLTYYAGDYYVALTDYGGAQLGQNGSIRPVLRVWKNGTLRAVTEYQFGCPGGAQDWWVALRIRDANIYGVDSTNYDPDGNGTPQSNCGTGSLNAPVLPYPVP